MASTLQHLTIARRINGIHFNFKGNKLSKFLSGDYIKKEELIDDRKVELPLRLPMV